MSKLLAYIKSKKDYQPNPYRVDVMDGIRVLSVIIVLWFHFWQQTWLMPIYHTPFLSWLGIDSINVDCFRRAGYLFVDMMVLLSAFSLFLPHARAMLMGEKTPKIKDLYIRRVARIVPSYLFSVLVLLVIALASGSYFSAKDMILDLVTHLTFTQMFTAQTYIYTNLNVVLWTVSLLAMFYLVFPLLAFCFRKHGVPTYIAMVFLGLVSTLLMAKYYSNTAMVVNQFPTFVPVFANGMAAAYLYVWYQTRCRIKGWLSPLFTLLAIGSIAAVVLMVKDCANNYQTQQLWQMENRFLLSGIFALMLLFSSFAIKPFKKIFSNKIASAMASISFNLYIWHQWVIVQLRSSFGFNSGADVAQAGSDIQLALTLMAFAISIIVAIFATYCIEKPFSKLILKSIRKDNNSALSL